MDTKQEDQFLQYTGITFLGFMVLAFFNSSAGAVSPFENTDAVNLTSAGGYIVNVILFYFCFHKQLNQNKQTETFHWQPQFSRWQKILLFLFLLFSMLFIMDILAVFSVTPWNMYHADKVTVAVGSIGFFKAVFFITFYAMCEEIMFRRILLRSQTDIGLGFALVSSSVLFALCHGSQIFAVFVAGMAWGGIYILTGSMIYPILMHVFNNVFKFYIVDYISPFIPENELRLTLLAIYGIASVILFAFCLNNRNLRTAFKKLNVKNMKAHFRNCKKLYVEFFRSPGTLMLILMLLVFKFVESVSKNSY